MSKATFRYVSLLIVLQQVRSIVFASEIAQGFSHDQLTRMLNYDWESYCLFEEALSSQLNDLVGGYLLLDDSVLEKHYSKKLWEACWGYSGKSKKVVYGIPIVTLLWTDGKRMVPIGFRVYRKGGSGKTMLALELLSHARNRLSLKPDWVFFDSWYASAAILKRLNDYAWPLISQLKKNRSFNGKQLKDYRKTPYWNEVGKLSKGLIVLVIRHGKKYFVTNRLTQDPKFIRKVYRKRRIIEDFLLF